MDFWPEGTERASPRTGSGDFLAGQIAAFLKSISHLLTINTLKRLIENIHHESPGSGRV